MPKVVSGLSAAEDNVDIHETLINEAHASEELSMTSRTLIG